MLQSFFFTVTLSYRCLKVWQNSQSHPQTIARGSTWSPNFHEVQISPSTYTLRTNSILEPSWTATSAYHAVTPSLILQEISNMPFFHLVYHSRRVSPTAAARAFPRRVSPCGGAASSTEPCANGLIASHCLPLSLRLKLRELLPPQPPPASGSPTQVASMSVGPCVGSLHGPCAATFASPYAGGLHRTLLRGLHLVTATRVLLWHPALIRVCSSSNRWSCQQQVILV